MSARVRRTPTPSQPPDFLASVSDLMSGLIFIFIITIAVFALRLAKATTEIRNADTVRREVVDSIVKELKQRDIEVRVDREQEVLRLTDQAISFPRGESTPEEGRRSNVGVIAKVLVGVLSSYVADFGQRGEASPANERPTYCEGTEATILESLPDKTRDNGAKVNTLLVEGHTDTVLIGPGFRYRDNLELSAARSAEVYRMMLKCEPELSRLVNRTGAPVLSVSGYGATRTIEDDGEADANRRIDLRFLMEPPQAEDSKPPAPVEETRRKLTE